MGRTNITLFFKKKPLLPQNLAARKHVDDVRFGYFCCFRRSCFVILYAPMFLFRSAESSSPWTRCVIPSTNKPQPAAPSLVKRLRKRRFSFALLRNQWWSWCHCFINTLTPFLKKKKEPNNFKWYFTEIFLKRVFKMSCTFAVKTWMKLHVSWLFS